MKQISTPRMFGALALALLTFSFTSAQGTVSAHIGPAFPMGKFSDNMDPDVDGEAAMGFGIGVQYVYPLKVEGLGLFGGLDIIINGLQKDVKDQLENANPTSSFTYEKYFNIPVTLGAHYAYPLTDNLAIYGNLGPAIDFLKMSKFTWIEPGDDDYTETYDLSVAIGILFGVGVVLNDQVDIGLSLMALGKHTVKTTKEYGGTSHFDIERKVALFNLTVGYHFMQ